MKKKKQSFSKLNKTKIARLNALQSFHIIGGTEIENTITKCEYVTCDAGNTGGGQGGGRSDDAVCTQ